MRTYFGRILFALAGQIVLAIATIAGLICLFLAPDSAPNNTEALTAALKSARLSPLPVSAHDLDISTEGNFFTRGFRICFTAHAPDVNLWLRQSPATRDLRPVLLPFGARRFQLAPTTDAVQSEVNVDYTGRSVSIYVSSS